MSRKTVGWLVGIVGMIFAFSYLVASDILDTIFADGRTPNITGPGVEVHLIDRYPLAGAKVPLDITARGGMRAGIKKAELFLDGQRHDSIMGKGAHWGGTIHHKRSRGRGRDTQRAFLQIPENARVGDVLLVQAKVDYLVAMSSGTTFFDNRSHSQTVDLNIEVYSKQGRFVAHCLVVARSFFLLLIWLGICCRIAFFLYRTKEGEPDSEEMLAIGLLLGWIGLVTMGYWVFSRPLMSVFGLVSDYWLYSFTIFWAIAPVIASWWLARRRQMVLIDV